MSTSADPYATNRNREQFRRLLRRLPPAERAKWMANAESTGFDGATVGRRDGRVEFHNRGVRICIDVDAFLRRRGTSV